MARKPALIKAADASDFGKLADASKRFSSGGRTPSAALLIWFLQHVKRLDEDEAVDAVCDGRGDKGIDGVWIDHVSEEVNILQAKHRRDLRTTQGDSDLQKLLGAAGWFTSADQIAELLKASPNAELAGLVERHDVAALLTDGYRVRCVFVTNGRFDRSGSDFLSAHTSGPPPLEGWDITRLRPYIRYADRQLYVDETATISFAAGGYFTLPNGTRPQVTFGAVPAPQIAKLPGIEDRSLFAQNVRFDLGRTRVNKEINVTLQDPDEHVRFVTFHNGLTILCKQITRAGRRFRISGFSVVNGCQSVVALHSNRKHLSDELLVPVRLVKVSEDADSLADDITYRSNNQNAINLKDLRANDSTQVYLQAQFHELFGDRAHYQIKRGEETDAPVVVPNDLAGQILLGLYNQEPWMSHRKFDLFDQRYKDVFHPSIQAAHIFLAYLIYEEVRQRLPGIANRLMARYGLSTFVLVYLVGELMREAEIGQEILTDPLNHLQNNESGVRTAIGRLIDDILIDFNAYVKDQEDKNGYFDYKTAFKSQRAVEALQDDVVRQHKRAVLRNKDIAFHID